MAELNGSATWIGLKSAEIRNILGAEMFRDTPETQSGPASSCVLGIFGRRRTRAPLAGTTMVAKRWMAPVTDVDIGEGRFGVGCANIMISAARTKALRL